MDERFLPSEWELVINFLPGSSFKLCSFKVKILTLVLQIKINIVYTPI